MRFENSTSGESFYLNLADVESSWAPGLSGVDGAIEPVIRSGDVDGTLVEFGIHDDYEYRLGEFLRKYNLLPLVTG